MDDSVIYYCKNCGCKVAIIKNKSLLKKGIVFLCSKCYDILNTGNMFGEIFKGGK